MLVKFQNLEGNIETNIPALKLTSRGRPQGVALRVRGMRPGRHQDRLQGRRGGPCRRGWGRRSRPRGRGRVLGAARQAAAARAWCCTPRTTWGWAGGSAAGWWPRPRGNRCTTRPGSAPPNNIPQSHQHKPWNSEDHTAREIIASKVSVAKSMRDPPLTARPVCVGSFIMPMDAVLSRWSRLWTTRHRAPLFISHLQCSAVLCSAVAIPAETRPNAAPQYVVKD